MQLNDKCEEGTLLQKYSTKFLPREARRGQHRVMAGGRSPQE